MVFVLVLLSTTDEFLLQLENDIVAELSELAQQERRHGMAAVLDAIDLRANDRSGSDKFYVLFDANGRRAGGNLPIRRPFHGWTEVGLAFEDAADASRSRWIRVTGRHLANGGFLAVGRDRVNVDNARAVIILSFAFCVVTAAALIAVSTFYVGSAILRRIEAAAWAAEEIMAGDLSQRIAISGRGDELDELALTFNAMLDRIQALMGQVGQVSNDIAHDLRTPLSRLRHGLEAARRRAVSIEDYTQAVDRAIEQVDEALVIFTSLLRIAEIESGAQRAAFGPVRLDELLWMLVDTFAPVAEDRNQRIVTRIAEPAIVIGDRSLLNQLFANLIENAIHHSPGGTSIELVLGREGGQVVVLVCDEGPGIPASKRRIVFQRFVRLDHSRGSLGSGLGLSMVRAIADLHNVQIELDDAHAGKAMPGLRVRLAFPDPQATPAARPAELAVSRFLTKP